MNRLFSARFCTRSGFSLVICNKGICKVQDLTPTLIISRHQVNCNITGVKNQAKIMFFAEMMQRAPLRPNKCGPSRHTE